MTPQIKDLATKAIHAGEPVPRIAGAVVAPIFQSANFEYGGESSYHDLRYIRLNNTPTHDVLHAKLAALEGAEAAVVTASGMAAISTALLSVLSPGGHLLVQGNLYGGTHSFVTRDLADFGMTYTVIDADDPASWAASLQPTTRAIYVEAMTNPLLQVADLAAVPTFARQHGLVSLIDSTFPSPVNFRPVEHGFHVVLHSATKYLNGHSDIVAGAVVGRSDLVEMIRHRLNHLGGALDPHAGFLLHRGLKTLPVRVRYQNESALAIAHRLERHPAVERVNYPGLASHPRHKRATQLFDGFSGMLSFELSGGRDVADRFIKRVQLPVSAPSLGGVETLLTLPATTSHAGMQPEERHLAGIGDGLIRVSVGLESTSELIEDFEHSLDQVGIPLAD
ncbi:MAG: aminotransferase class I/II-fold pyridoxal phosphate-dependent enzyme [Acidobacteriota bacterium]|nr:aminotransferase class I/II-fold pyridoxal phosphate-dependent enzyme [Acidobacteriota bacterium]